MVERTRSRSVSMPVEGGTAESRVSLEYPNGRRVEAVVARGRLVQTGDEFELHGHRWRAIRPVRRSRHGADDGPMLCTSVGRIAAPAPG